MKSFKLLQLLTIIFILGKNSNGGHRLGEMESVAIVGNGAALTHKALWRQSDPSVWARCKSCGLYNEKDREECRHCKSNDIECVEIPYCMKLLQQGKYTTKQH